MRFGVCETKNALLLCCQECTTWCVAAAAVLFASQRVCLGGMTVPGRHASAPPCCLCDVQAIVVERTTCGSGLTLGLAFVGS